MSLLAALIVGGLVGWLAAKLMGRDEGIIMSVIIGVVGAVIGSFIAPLFGSGQDAYLTFSWAGIFWSLIGSVILVFILNAIQHRPHHSV